jgi:hypothetical protein
VFEPYPPSEGRTFRMKTPDVLAWWRHAASHNHEGGIHFLNFAEAFMPYICSTISAKNHFNMILLPKVKSNLLLICLIPVIWYTESESSCS